MTDTLKALDTDELRRLMAEATPGPWLRASDKLAAGNVKASDNAALIVTAVNALPGLLAERDRMREALEEIARCERYLSEADTSYEYEMRQIELCRFIKTRAALGEQP